MKDVYTTEQAAALSYVSGSTIRRALDTGTLKGFRIDTGAPVGPAAGKHRRVRRADLIRWVAEHNIPLDRMGPLTEAERGIVAETQQSQVS